MQIRTFSMNRTILSGKIELSLNLYLLKLAIPLLAGDSAWRMILKKPEIVRLQLNFFQALCIACDHNFLTNTDPCFGPYFFHCSSPSALIDPHNGHICKVIDNCIKVSIQINYVVLGHPYNLTFSHMYQNLIFYLKSLQIYKYCIYHGNKNATLSIDFSTAIHL